MEHAKLPVTVTLSVEEITFLLTCAREAPVPHRVSDPVIRAVIAQVAPQVEAAEAASKEAPEVAPAS